MDPSPLKERTQNFALQIIRLVESLPRNRIVNVLGNQLLRCGTSVGANYRAACRARSPADFISKMGIVEEETDESIYWMELLVSAGIVKPDQVLSLINEANEILAMTVTSIRTARKHRS